MTEAIADEDLREQAIHVLRTSGIEWAYGRYNALGESEAERAVAALASAGLLGTPPCEIGDQGGRLTLREARARYEARCSELDGWMTIAAAGTLRLGRSRSARLFVTSDHRGDLYRGDDLGEALAAYNAALDARKGSA